MFSFKTRVVVLEPKEYKKREATVRPLPAREKPTSRPYTDIVTDRYNGETNDCVVVALSVAFGRPYSEAHTFARTVFKRPDGKGVTNTASKMRAICSKGLFNRSITEIPSHKLYNPSYNTSAVRFTVDSFKKHFTQGTYFVLVSGHALVIKDGILIDNANYMDRGGKRRIKSAFKVG
jgi:hypothetical protein